MSVPSTQAEAGCAFLKLDFTAAVKGVQWPKMVNFGVGKKRDRERERKERRKRKERKRSAQLLHFQYL